MQFIEFKHDLVCLPACSIAGIDPSLSNHLETRIPEWSIELLRGVAAVMVLITHYHDLAGWHSEALNFFHVGVDLFFVISGYVFAPYFYGKKLSTPSFWLKRLFRVYPLYFIAVLVYAMLRPYNPEWGSNLLKHLLFLHTFETREVAFSLNPAFWSLPPEVEFYLLLPLLTYLTASRITRLMALTLIMINLRCFVFNDGYHFEGASVLGGLRYHVPGLLSEFLFGAFAWFWSKSAPSVIARVMFCSVGLLVLGFLSTCFVLLSSGGSTEIQGYSCVFTNFNGLMSAGAFACIVAGLSHLRHCPWNGLRILSLGAGELSYGIYLFHNAAPLMLERVGFHGGSLTFMLMSVLLTLTMSALLHVMIESPLRRYGRELAIHRHGQLVM